MSSTTTTTTTMSLGLRRITTLGRKNPWPDPLLSIGECWCSMGSNCCWEPIGPAKEKFDQISHQIKGLLDSRGEYLSEGVCVRRLLIFELYMIGRTAEFAKPTIIFSCENKTQRQRAKKLVRESGILSGCPGIGLGESSRPLRLSRSPKPLGEQSMFSDDIEMSICAGLLSVPDASIWYSSQLSDMHCTPITIKRAGAEALLSIRKSTLGVVCIGDELLGLTVAHAFFDDSDNESSSGSDLEFSLEDEDDVGDAFEYNDDFIDMTSRGSVSPKQWLEDSRVLLEQPTWSEIEPGTSFRDETNENGKNKIETIEAPTKCLGRMLAMSQPTTTTNLDWALVRIDCADFHSSLSKLPKTPRIEHVEVSLNGAQTVHAITGSSGNLAGRITGSSTFMQLPGSTAFQEVWTVQLNGPLQSGDSGSWVINPKSGGLYGYIVAGDPQTSIAYIVPAHQAFSAIEQQLGIKVTFPSEKQLLSLRGTAIYADDPMDCATESGDSSTSSDSWCPSEDEDADDDPYPGNHIKRNKTWSSRPTTPSETSYDVDEIDFYQPVKPFQDSILTIEKLSGVLSFPNRELHKERQPVFWSIDWVEDPLVLPTVLPPLATESQTGDIKVEHIIQEHIHLFHPSAVPKHDQPGQSIRKPLPKILGNPARGRQRALIDVEKKQARDVRQVRACWACHISKTKCSPCSPGSPCEQCARLAGKRRFCLFSCFNDPLESLATFLLPQYLVGHFTRANVESFVTKNASNWGETSLHVNLIWGLRRPIDADVVNLQLHSHSELAFNHQALSLDSGESKLLIRKWSPPLGIPLASGVSMERKYERYIHDIVKHDLYEYVNTAYTDQESTFPERLLGSICSFLSKSRSSDQDYQILQRAVEMHVIFTILERSLILDEKSLKLVEEELGQNFPSRSSPRCAQRQIKLAFYNLQCRRVTQVLKEWGKLLWESSSTSQKPESWATTFCLMLLLALVIDKITISAYYFCEGRIEYHGNDPKMEREAFGELIRLTERELFERCKEIFHWKFKTRKGGKEACNPIRDGLVAFEKPSVPEPRTAELVMDLQDLVQDFEPQIRAHCSQIPQDGDPEYNPYTDAGRLTRIFLDDFLDR